MNELTTDVLDFRTMLLIRRTEELILDLFSESKVSGTTHTYIGQEANAVGIIGQLDPRRDFVVSNHRCHGHYLAFGGPVEGLLGEIMGRTIGVCGGRGGSQQLKFGNFFSNGVLGGVTPIGCGLALGEKLRGSDGIVIVCVGDGTLGQGVLYESLNMAALWQLPVLFLVENNRYAQTTPVELAVSGSIVGRAAPFGIELSEIESTDVRALRAWGSDAIDCVRTRCRPFWGVIHTYRLSAHSKGDDTRPDAEVERYKQQDPLLIQASRLSDEEKLAAEQWVENTLALVLGSVEEAPIAKTIEELRSETSC